MSSALPQMHPQMLFFDNYGISRNLRIQDGQQRWGIPEAKRRHRKNLFHYRAGGQLLQVHQRIDRQLALEISRSETLGCIGIETASEFVHLFGWHGDARSLSMA